ncbi:MAG: hypothetical protein WCK47_14045 [bacterium]
MFNLSEEAALIFKALNSAGVGYALAGGLAVSLYATPRATMDIDLLLDPAAWPGAVMALNRAGYQELTSPIVLKTVTIRRMTKLSPDDTLWIDFIMATPLLQPVLAARQILKWNNIEVPVVTPEGLITLKRLRGSPQDEADIESLSQACDNNEPSDQQ